MTAFEQNLFNYIRYHSIDTFNSGESKITLSFSEALKVTKAAIAAINQAVSEIEEEHEYIELFCKNK